MDKLDIIGLKVNTHIGVHAFEKKILQPLVIDISIPLDTCNLSDDITATLDYDKLAQAITEFVATHHFQLIESVANALLQFIETEFHIKPSMLSVSKPHAISNAQSIRITLNR